MMKFFSDRDLYIFKVTPIDDLVIFYKVGVSCDIEQRRGAIGRENKRSIVTILAIFPQKAWAEKALLEKLRQYNISGEYFRSNPILDLAERDDISLMDLLYHGTCWERKTVEALPHNRTDRDSIRDWRIRENVNRGLLLTEVAKMEGLSPTRIGQIVGVGKV